MDLGGPTWTTEAVWPPAWLQKPAQTTQTIQPAGRGDRPSPPASLQTSAPSPLLPPWDQAEADRLLAETRAVVASAEAEHRAGRMTAVRLNVVRLWLDVCLGYDRDHELEARRGWDVMLLLRAATRRAIRAAAGEVPPPITRTRAEETRLRRRNDGRKYPSSATAKPAPKNPEGGRKSSGLACKAAGARAKPRFLERIRVRG